MAQLDRRNITSESPQSQNSPTFEQLLKVEETYWSATTSPTHRIIPDQDESLSTHHNKKSVLMKVKERAKKLRHSLSGKKKHESDQSNGHDTPPWGVTLDDESDDELDDDPEYLGAPMYESEAAPKALKETARQHPRAVPVVPENHRVPSVMKREATPENKLPVTPNMTITETVAEKLAPAYAAVSDATHKLASKLASLAIATGEPDEQAPFHAEQIDASPPNAANLSPQTWDKGVSVKEYFLNKLEPGEDERALSQVITEAISPTKATRDTGVVEKVKDAVTSFFWQEETSHSVKKPASLSSASTSVSTPTQRNRMASVNAHSSGVHYPSRDSSSPIPLSSHAYEVYEEENHGKILQAN